jgi:hypothetical protein
MAKCSDFAKILVNFWYKFCRNLGVFSFSRTVLKTWFSINYFAFLMFFFWHFIINQLFNMVRVHEKMPRFHQNWYRKLTNILAKSGQFFIYSNHVKKLILCNYFQFFFSFLTFFDIFLTFILEELNFLPCLK